MRRLLLQSYSCTGNHRQDIDCAFNCHQKRKHTEKLKKNLDGIIAINTKIGRYSRTNKPWKHLLVDPQKSPWTPERGPYLPPAPPSLMGFPQFHPNWMESLMYRRLAPLYSRSVQCTKAPLDNVINVVLEQSVIVTLHYWCPQPWGGDIVTSLKVPIQVNHVNFKLKQHQV